MSLSTYKDESEATVRMSLLFEFELYDLPLPFVHL